MVTGIIYVGWLGAVVVSWLAYWTLDQAIMGLTPSSVALSL